MINLLLCGGVGSRLWPLSRNKLPKQFVRLFDNQSLFQATLSRNALVAEQFLIVSNLEQYFLALDQMTGLVEHFPTNFLLEPVGRNTAPAIALACLGLSPDDLVLVTPSDHLIKNTDAYQVAVERAQHLAQQGFLVTFGIQPRYAETGYGYIQAKGEDVLSFKEKPDAMTAQSYIDSGQYFWNGGIFCFKVGVYLEELQIHSPEIYQACVLAATQKTQVDNITRIGLAQMQAIADKSIDYAVLEKSQKVKMVACDMNWSDMGSFDALYQEMQPAHALPPENIQLNTHNAPELIQLDSARNLIVHSDRQIALVDVQDLLIVDSPDALLISQRGSSQKIKQVVEQLKVCNPELVDVSRLVYRPWGSYEVLVDSKQYKVKRIVVKPGAKLSMQKHFHRNEHWVVVSGTATVTLEDNQFLVRPNESTYIQMGQAHRLANEGKIDLVIVEVQVGEYTGEDDIVRLDDIYIR